MSKFKCKKCNFLNEDNKEQVSFFRLAAKLGTYAVVIYFAISFLALFIFVALVVVMDGICSSSSSSSSSSPGSVERQRCKRCGHEHEGGA